MSSVSLDMAVAQQPPLSYDEKPEGTKIPDMPTYWDFKKYNVQSWFDRRRFIYLVNRFLCVIGFGTGDLHRIWKGSYPNCSEEEFDKVSERLRLRLEHLNLVVRPRRFNGHFLVLTTVPDLVCFVPFRNGGFLHHGPPRIRAEDQSITTVHGLVPLLRPRDICRFCPHSPDSRIYCSACDS